MKVRIKNISRVLLLSLFLAYLGGITLFYHKHEVNGKALFHSHPYWPFSENQPVNHQHSGDQFFTIGFLSLFLSLAVAAFTQLFNRSGFVTRLIGIYREPVRLKHSSIPFLLRAPPVAILL